MQRLQDPFLKQAIDWGLYILLINIFCLIWGAGNKAILHAHMEACTEINSLQHHQRGYRKKQKLGLY